MATRDFLRIRRRVRFGGRPFGAGPFRFHLGGAWYTVGPLSLVRADQFFRTVCNLAQVANGIEGLGLADPSTMRAVLPLIVEEPIRQRDLDGASATQVLAALQALGECNDWEAWGRLFDGEDDGGGSDDGTPWTLEDLVDWIVAERPCYTHRDLFFMPFQEFGAIVAAVSKKHRAAARGEDEHPLPPGAVPLTEKEKRELRDRITSAREVE